MSAQSKAKQATGIVLIPAVPLEERDDINKLPLPAAAKRYARRHGLAAMKRQPAEFQRVNATITNPGRKDHFQNYEVGRTTSGGKLGRAGQAIKERAEKLVRELLEN